MYGGYITEINSLINIARIIFKRRLMEINKQGRDSNP
jgi:hypothetical protein